MSLETNIAWCHSTLPYWEGCTPVSEECANCWAWTRDKRHLIEKVNHFGNGAPRRMVKGFSASLRKMNREPVICDVCGKGLLDGYALHDCNGEHDARPSSFSRRRIFVNHTSDFLDPEVPDRMLADMLGEILENDSCIRIFCTKRPELFFKRLYAAYQVHRNPKIHAWIDGHAPAGVCLLVSVGSGKHVGRIPYLRAIPANWRGVSIEPLLAPFSCSFRGLNWVIIGGESGPKARVCCHHWITELVQYAQRDECAVFVKQTGTNYEREFKRIRTKDYAGADPEEWTNDIKIREYPSGF